MGGLVFSQLITLYITPVIYLYLDSFQKWLRRRRGRPTPIGEQEPETVLG